MLSQKPKLSLHRNLITQRILNTQFHKTIGFFSSRLPNVVQYTEIKKFINLSNIFLTTNVGFINSLLELSEAQLFSPELRYFEKASDATKTKTLLVRMSIYSTICCQLDGLIWYLQIQIAPSNTIVKIARSILPPIVMN